MGSLPKYEEAMSALGAVNNKSEKTVTPTKRHNVQ
jgi:hypothetical protein